MPGLESLWVYDNFRVRPCLGIYEKVIYGTRLKSLLVKTVLTPEVFELPSFHVLSRRSPVFVLSFFHLIRYPAYKFHNRIIIAASLRTEKPNRSARTGRKATGLRLLLHTGESRAAIKDTKCCSWRLFLFLEDEQLFVSLKSLILANK